MNKHFCWFLLLALTAMAQETLIPNDVKDVRGETYALTNITLHSDEATVVEKATLLIRKGVVVAVGANVSLPADAVVFDLQGKHVYPSFIDPYTEYGLPERPKRSGGDPFGSKEQMGPEVPGAYGANDAIQSQYRAADNFTVAGDDAKTLRAAGFGAVLSFRADGVARGTGCLVTLADDRANNVVLVADASANYSLLRGSSKQHYPVSPMGALALLRQTHFDALWYEGTNPKPFTDQSLDSWLRNRKLPQIFEANGWRDILRASALGKELGISFVVKSDGDEYRRVQEIKAAGVTLIVPVDYPEAMNIEDPLDAEEVTLVDLKHWELAPSNASFLAKAGIPFALTSSGLKDKAKFMDQVRNAIERGLSESEALASLTRAPAKILGQESRLGQLKPGFLANFLVTDGKLFAKESQILENWVNGKRNILINATEANLVGSYKLDLGKGEARTLFISGKPGEYKAEFKAPESAAKDADPAKEKGEGKKIGGLKLEVNGELVTLSSAGDKENPGFRFSAWRAGKNLEGRVAHEDGSSAAGSASYQGPVPEDKDDVSKKAEEAKQPLSEITYPFAPYGWKTEPAQETILIQNATVWTNEADGILKDTDVLVKNGKISQIGKGLSAAGARVIDATGKHLTSGIIDEHSHLALDDTNEVAINSGMVRMGDMVDSDDINVYRNLAGGVTAAQLLHGSANPVGGQSALIKMRWGASPQGMLIEGADGFIKFALGENVKRSGSSASIRYPQTRMGVEQVYRDAFSSARDYQKAWQAYNALSAKDKATALAPRKDLTLETMVEILEGKRFITCHSYVQSEINMLMHLAEDFGFHVNTFTHILEGYKVADKMAKHGVGGSTFADWWAYKWEVVYAIPYNAALMHDAGVVVAINSDSAEMSRRLNQEAAKAVKYGGVSEEEAWKMVTLNPARLLHLDSQMGSVKVGKDADLVVWSDLPLSIYAQAQTTMVDGRVYFDQAQDEKLQTEVQAERARLIQKLLKEGKAGGGARPSGKFKPDFHCDTVIGWQGGEE